MDAFSPMTRSEKMFGWENLKPSSNQKTIVRIG
jgi:hypothetical protein